MLQKKITFDSFIRGILTAVVIIGILYLVNQLSGVLLPFFVAWLIAYLIYPMVIFFQHKLRLKNRVISIFVVLLVLLSIITLAFIGLVPPIIEEFGKLKELLTEYFIEGSKQAAIPGTVANFIKEHIDMLKIHEALNENNFANTMRCLLYTSPGATAFVPALVASGLPDERFCFEGFLPQKKGRVTRLTSLQEEKRTMIFYESPYRLVKTLTQFAEFFGAERPVSVCREISKIHEESRCV